MKQNFTVTLISVILTTMIFLSCATTPDAGNRNGEFKMNELKIEKDEKTIFGQIFMPSNSETKHPLIIMSHGYNGCYTDFFADAVFFAQNGYVCYCYDFCGGSNRSKSSGKTTEMTVYTEKQDLLDIFSYFEEQDYIDSEKIYLWGGSQGGFVSALAAAELNSKVKGLILLYPALCIPDNWNETYKSESEIPESLNFWGMTLGREFFITARNIDVYQTICSYTGPVYIFHGTNDQIVPVSYSEKAKKIYKKAILVTLPGEGHGFTPNAQSQVRKYALKFIR